jgi:glutathione S-transferase
LLVFAEDSPYRSDAAAAPRLVSFSGPLRDKHNLLEPNHVPPFMLTLFHHPMLASCRFIRLTFGEHGEEIQLVEEMPWTRRPEFLALNPAGGLPVLLAEGDVPIVGAYAIAEYLDETRGILKRDKRLLAENPMDRAEIRRLIDWYLGKMETEVTRHLVRERVLKRLMPDGGGSPDSAAIRAARSNVKQHLKYTNWLTITIPWRSRASWKDPQTLWPPVQSWLAMNYAAGRPAASRIVKVFVDTAPVMEKPLAQPRASAGRASTPTSSAANIGSWLFLGAIFTTLDLSADEAESDHCGSAAPASMPARPTPFPRRTSSMRGAAFPTSPSNTKARFPHGRVPAALIGNRIYGCDDCLAVCPWNKFTAG